jgi:hypothetical protein
LINKDLSIKKRSFSINSSKSDVPSNNCFSDNFPGPKSILVISQSILVKTKNYISEEEANESAERRR